MFGSGPNRSLPKVVLREQVSFIARVALSNITESGSYRFYSPTMIAHGVRISLYISIIYGVDNDVECYMSWKAKRIFIGGVIGFTEGAEN